MKEVTAAQSVFCTPIALSHSRKRLPAGLLTDLDEQDRERKRDAESWARNLKKKIERTCFPDEETWITVRGATLSPLRRRLGSTGKITKALRATIHTDLQNIGDCCRTNLEPSNLVSAAARPRSNTRRPCSKNMTRAPKPSLVVSRCGSHSYLQGEEGGTRRLPRGGEEAAG